jgi:hypothetical protein
LESLKLRPLQAVYILEGLRDAKKYHIPEAEPEVPRGVIVHANGDEWARVEALKEAAEVNAAHDRARHRRDLWKTRRDLTSGIVDLYSAPPYPAAELRKLATAILDDPAAVDALMKEIEKNGALKDDPPPAEPPVRATAPKAAKPGAK